MLGDTWTNLYTLRKMLRLSALLLTIGFLGTMAIFNPGKESYQDFIASYLYEQKKADKGFCKDLDLEVEIGVARRILSVLIDTADVCNDVTVFGKALFQNKNLENQIKAEAASAERYNLLFGSLYRFEYEGTVYGTVGALGKMRVVTTSTVPAKLPSAAVE